MKLDRRQLNELRESLENRHKALLAELKDDRTKALTLVPEEQDGREAAAGLADLQVADAELGRDWREMEQVQAALGRMDRGQYGDCIDCGEAIGIRRLVESPGAARCMRCQEAVERGAGY